MKIYVTKEHIRKGAPGDCRKCPIANALSEIFDEPFEIKNGYCDDGYNGALVQFPQGSYLSHIRLPLPQICRDFISRFDNLKRCRPFTFELLLSK